MSKHKDIIEGLSSKRKSAYISEEVTKQAKSAVDKFMKEQKASSDIRKKITNILNHIYLECNKAGENLLTGGTFDYTKGDMVDHGGPESGPDPELYPSVYELKLGIRFSDRKVDIDQVWKSLADSIDKSMKKNFTESHIDGFSYDISIDSPMSSKNPVDVFGFYISIERPRSTSIVITLGHMTNPLNESKEIKTQQIRYYKSSDADYTFGFSIIGDKEPRGMTKRLSVSVKDNLSGKRAVGCISLSDLDISKIISSLQGEKSLVSSALKRAGYEKRDLERIVAQLVDSDNETGVGQEIGLPIDKENCESTSISNIATPDGKVGVYYKRKNIAIDESGDENFKAKEDEKVEFTQEEGEPRDTISCPKCHSLNVNVVGVDRFYCSDCSNEWRDVNNDTIPDDKEEVDGMLDNSADEPPLKVYNTNSYSSIY